MERVRIIIINHIDTVLRTIHTDYPNSKNNEKSFLVEKKMKETIKNKVTEGELEMITKIRRMNIKLKEEKKIK